MKISTFCQFYVYSYTYLVFFKSILRVKVMNFVCYKEMYKIGGIFELI